MPCISLKEDSNLVNRGKINALRREMTDNISANNTSHRSQCLLQAHSHENSREDTCGTCLSERRGKDVAEERRALYNNMFSHLRRSKLG